MERLHPEISPGPELDHLEEFWTPLDELGFQMGDMHGEWKIRKKPKEKPLVLPPVRQPPVERKHIKKDGKR